jgi:hypothetical protein
MFTTDGCEPTLPKSIHLKRESSSIVSQQTKVNKHIDTTTLINNISTSTIDSSPILENSSTRVSSTIMTGKFFFIYDVNKKKYR